MRREGGPDFCPVPGGGRKAVDEQEGAAGSLRLRKNGAVGRVSSRSPLARQASQSSAAALILRALRDRLRE